MVPLKGKIIHGRAIVRVPMNDLLEEDIWFSHEVLLPIADYCVKRHRYEEPALSDHERTKALKDFRLALFTASEGLISCIKAIYKKEK